MKTLQLVDTASGRILLEFKPRGWVIHDHWLKIVMNKKGVAIPPYRRAAYDGKIFITSNHPFFPRAFQELYYPLEFDEQRFVFQTVPSELNR
jgi:hypothetical protein